NSPERTVYRTDTPRERLGWIVRVVAPGYVSIHAPRVGERPCNSRARPPHQLFQSTLPAWGSDVSADGGFKLVDGFQSTLPAWGSDEHRRDSVADRRGVSIHAPRVGERRWRTRACGIG